MLLLGISDEQQDQFSPLIRSFLKEGRNPLGSYRMRSAWVGHRDSDHRIYTF